MIRPPDAHRVLPRRALLLLVIALAWAGWSWLSSDYESIPQAPKVRMQA